MCYGIHIIRDELKLSFTPYELAKPTVKLHLNEVLTDECSMISRKLILKQNATPVVSDC